VIQNEVEDRLSDALLEGKYEEGDTIRLDYIDGQVTAERILVAEAEPAEPALTPYQVRYMVGKGSHSGPFLLLVGVALRPASAAASLECRP
jgi:hypothetical protein